MLYQKRINEIFRKARDTMQELSYLSSTDSTNKQVRFKVSCIIWELKQKYLAEGAPYNVSKKSYEADFEKITALEDRLIQDGAYGAEALEAIKEAKEYLELIAGYRVRKPDKNRVY